jgi:phage tail-like protein
MNRGRWLIDQLPVAMLDDDFLIRFLSIFQTVADTYMDHVDNLDHVLDLAVAPESMVRYMGEWLGARSIDPSLPDDLQRHIVREHGRMLPWRGTVRGLRELLEMVTRGPVLISDTGGVFAEGEAPTNTGHVHILVTSTGWATDDDIVDLIQADLPASVSFELHVGDRQVWPRVPFAVASGSGPAETV